MQPTLQKHTTEKNGRPVDVYYTTRGGQVSLRKTVYADTKQGVYYSENEEEDLIHEIQEGI